MHTGTQKHSQNHDNNNLAEIIRVCQVLMVSYLSNNRQHQRNKAECRAIYLHYYVVWDEQNNKQPMSCDAQLAGKGECQSRETLGGKLSKRNGRGIVWSKPRVNCPGKCLGKCTWGMSGGIVPGKVRNICPGRCQDDHAGLQVYVHPL